MVLGRGQGREAAELHGALRRRRRRRERRAALPRDCRASWASSPSACHGTREWDTDYEAKTAAALGILEKHDFAAVHLEGPDEATHNHDLEHKIYSVECLSERVVKPLCEALRAKGEDFRLLILSDHRTFMRNGAHGATPVPFMIYDSREENPGSGLPYSEKNGEAGPFLTSGTELMPLLFGV